RAAAASSFAGQDDADQPLLLVDALQLTALHPSPDRFDSHSQPCGGSGKLEVPARFRQVEALGDDLGVAVPLLGISDPAPLEGEAAELPPAGGDGAFLAGDDPDADEHQTA